MRAASSHASITRDGCPRAHRSRPVPRAPLGALGPDHDRHAVRHARRRRAGDPRHLRRAAGDGALARRLPRGGPADRARRAALRAPTAPTSMSAGARRCEGGARMLAPGNARHRAGTGPRSRGRARARRRGCCWRASRSRSAPREWALYKPRWGAFYGTPPGGAPARARAWTRSSSAAATSRTARAPRSTRRASATSAVVLARDALSGLYERGERELAGSACCCSTRAAVPRGRSRAPAAAPAPRVSGPAAAARSWRPARRPPPARAPVDPLVHAHDAAEARAGGVVVVQDRAADERAMAVDDAQDADLRAVVGGGDRAVDAGEARAPRPRQVAADADGDVLDRDPARDWRVRRRHDLEFRRVRVAEKREAEAAGRRRQLGVADLRERAREREGAGEQHDLAPGVARSPRACPGSRRACRRRRVWARCRSRATGAPSWSGRSGRRRTRCRRR